MEKIYTVDEITKITMPIFKKHGVKNAFLFGSYSRGEADTGSDIDFCINGGKVKGLFGLGSLYHDLSEALQKPIDLVTSESLEHRANVGRVEDFKARIEEDKKLVYEENS